MMMMMYFAFFVSDWLWQTSPSIFLLSLLCFRSITCYTPRLPVSYLNDAAMYMCLTLARAMSNVACVFPFSLSLSVYRYIYIYIYLYVFPRVIIYRWRWRQVNAKDGDHISFFFFSFWVVRRAYIAIACLTMCVLNVN